MTHKPQRPQSIDELFQRAAALAGRSFAELAAETGLQVPKDLRRDKGWVGQLLELQLGATAGSKPTQDFPELGVELKTLPVTPEGEPLETTFVCTAPLVNIQGVQWATSNVRNKLQQVLWLPIDGRRDVPLAERVVGSAFLWIPSAGEKPCCATTGKSTWTVLRWDRLRVLPRARVKPCKFALKRQTVQR